MANQFEPCFLPVEIYMENKFARVLD